MEILEAKYRNMFMVSVELPSSRRKGNTSDTALAYGYEINLSNDRLSFGESVNIIIYDESCYTCNSTSVTCTVLVGFYIKCYLLILKHIFKTMKTMFPSTALYRICCHISK